MALFWFPTGSRRASRGAAFVKPPYWGNDRKYANEVFQHTYLFISVSLRIFPKFFFFSFSRKYLKRGLNKMVAISQTAFYWISVNENCCSSIKILPVYIPTQGSPFSPWAFTHLYPLFTPLHRDCNLCVSLVRPQNWPGRRWRQKTRWRIKTPNCWANAQFMKNGTSNWQHFDRNGARSRKMSLFGAE